MRLITPETTMILDQEQTTAPVCGDREDEAEIVEQPDGALRPTLHRQDSAMDTCSNEEEEEADEEAEFQELPTLPNPERQRNEAMAKVVQLRQQGPMGRPAVKPQVLTALAARAQEPCSEALSIATPTRGRVSTRQRGREHPSSSPSRTGSPAKRARPSQHITNARWG